MKAKQMRRFIREPEEFASFSSLVSVIFFLFEEETMEKTLTRADRIKEWARLIAQKEDLEFDENVLHGSFQLVEGIDIDADNHVVSFNDTHERFVNTSLDGNPTVNNRLIPGVPVWSIFKRQADISRADGNPLVYALKGENGWRFKNKKDREAIDRQFKSIAEKFLKTHSYDITLVVPSSNTLNQFIADTIVSKSKNKIELIDGPVCKLTTDDVYELVNEIGSTFHKTYKGKEEFHRALAELENYLRKMDKYHGGKFTRHLVTNKEMRDAIDVTLKLSDDYTAEDANKINGSDVLIIDDVVSRGQSIKEMVKLISTTYSPKSITVLTLLSKRPKNRKR